MSSISSDLQMLASEIDGDEAEVRRTANAVEESGDISHPVGDNFKNSHISRLPCLT